MIRGHPKVGLSMAFDTVPWSSLRSRFRRAASKPGASRRCRRSPLADLTSTARLRELRAFGDDLVAAFRRPVWPICFADPLIRPADHRLSTYRAFHLALVALACGVN